MKAKVIIAQATAETAEALYGLVKKMVDTTAIKAYPSVDYQAVFFSADRYDLDFGKKEYWRISAFLSKLKMQNNTINK